MRIYIEGDGKVKFIVDDKDRILRFTDIKRVEITDDEIELLKGLIRLHIKDGFNRAIDIELLKKLESIPEHSRE